MAPAERHGRTNRRTGRGNGWSDGPTDRRTRDQRDMSRDRPVKISCSLTTVARIRSGLSTISISPESDPTDHPGSRSKTSTIFRDRVAIRTIFMMIVFLIVVWNRCFVKLGIC